MWLDVNCLYGEVISWRNNLGDICSKHYSAHILLKSPREVIWSPLGDLFLSITVRIVAHKELRLE